MANSNSDFRVSQNCVAMQITSVVSKDDNVNRHCQDGGVLCDMKWTKIADNYHDFARAMSCSWPFLSLSYSLVLQLHDATISRY